MNSRRQVIYDTHPDGARLRQVELELRRLGQREDATSLLCYVREAARGWLCTADPEIRAIAAELVRDCVKTIAVREAEDLWHQCERELS